MIDRNMNKCFIVCVALFTVAFLPAWSAEAADFGEWLSALREEARAKGISEETLDIALEGLQPIDRVIELDRNQPEFKKSFETYLGLMVNQARVNKGRQLLYKHRELLDEIHKKYGVQPWFLVAIWGLETNFGSNLGGFAVIRSLATLAHDERRSSFFRAELLYALKILDEGHISNSKMQGSWAGAMGQLQFMPSTFVTYAVDEDRDGRKDIWYSLSDVFASAANFLSSYNWRGDMIWGREVRIPPDFDHALAGLKKKKTLDEWQKIGIRRVNGENLPEFDTKASLILPSGNNGPAFLVYQNYRAIMRWNRSHLYALAVCNLADRLSGVGTVQSKNPR
jgi:membrane-bound lytic murein transglycosylase B